MKIGILTYHRAENYGALLQAYATKTYLQGLGHDVSFVDYWPTYHSDYFKIFSKTNFRSKNWRGKIVMLLQCLLWMFPKMIRKARLQRFVQERLGLAPKPQYVCDKDVTEMYDAVVYGSDQIWRKQHLGGVDFDPWYFGADVIRAKQKIVYAGSMGAVSTTEEDEAFLKKMMPHFDRISVREADLQQLLERLGFSATIVTDPVFLLSKEQWLKIAKPTFSNGRYILFYNLLQTQESVRFAEALSKKTGLPIKEINKKLTFRHLNQRYISTASVECFLGMVNDAAYVVSNSFHGVAFSIIFEKQFWAVGMKERANRVVSLLQHAGICERYVDNLSVLTADWPPIDYCSVNEKLGSVINSSKDFIRMPIGI